jgi:PAS domain S-box-containing protein
VGSQETGTIALQTFLRDLWPSLWFALVDGVHINDDRGRYILVNPAYCRLVGYEEAELVGESFLMVIPEEHREGYLRRYEQGRGEVGVRGEFQLQRRDGKRIHVATVLNAALEVDGRRLNAFITRDITAQRALEQQMLHGDRVRALGTLAGGVAHEFNNLLVGILGYAEMIADLEPEGPGRRFALKIQRAARRGTQITRQLLPFSRKEEFRKEAVDLHEVLRGATKMFRLSDAAGGIAFEQDLAAAHSWIRANSVQLHQVFLNLFINARDAMPNGGTLRVETCECAGGQIEVRVADTGYGMNEEVQRRVFEPFFTTKQGGEGTGLGMALVFSTVTSHGGILEVESTAGHGTVVRVCFPYIELL